MAPTADCLSDEDLLALASDEGDEGAAHASGCPRCGAAVVALRRQCASLRSALPAFRGSEPHAQPLAGRYQFLERVGAGGFGEVWLARDLRLDREVAVKCLRPDGLRPGAVDGLRSEAALLVKLSANRRVRRHLVQALDLIEDGGRVFLVMEYVAGGSLGDRLKVAGPLLWRTAVRYVADVGEALAAAHAAGVVHRDIKPDNILWSADDDTALLADFGIAGQVEGGPAAGGTIGYVAPELLLESASPAADVFALAATLYHLVGGAPPFPAGTLGESARRAAGGLPDPDPTFTRVPPGVEQVIQAGLAPAPRNRPPIREFVDRLRGAGAFALGAALPAPSANATAVAGRPDLSVEVSVSRDNRTFVPVLPAGSSDGHRNLQFVAPEPPAVHVPVDSFVRLRYRSASGGYLTLVNVGSSGQTRVLFPNPQATDGRIRPGEAKEVTVRVTPPDGTDEAVGLLTVTPELPEEWLRRLGVPTAGEPPTGYDGYRELEFLSESVAQAEPAAWAACAVQVVHRTAVTTS